MPPILRSIIPLTLALLAPNPGHGADLITVQRLSTDLATQAAQAAIADCRKQGYQVSAVVVDRNAIMQVLLRDDLAARFTMDLAEGKANAVILAGASSAELRGNRADIRDELNQTAGLLILAGGVPIRAAGSIVAAIGVSGAPGGELDEACALAGIEAIEETLEFAE